MSKTNFDSESVEKWMVIILVLIATYMFVESLTFQERVRLYPQITSGVVILTGVIILLRHRFSFESVKAIRGSVISSRGAEDTSIDKTQPKSEFEKTIQLDEVKLFSLITLYTLIGFAFGLLWATPLFVLSYALWVKMSWKRAVVLTGLATAIPYLIQFYLNIDYMSGVLLNSGRLL